MWVKYSADNSSRQDFGKAMHFYDQFSLVVLLPGIKANSFYRWVQLHAGLQAMLIACGATVCVPAAYTLLGMYLACSLAGF